ncbi:protein kinase [Brasilonema octagenarum UFV-E1]|uniref:non-specific serine/threonine protein kinase n=1 Tax=Brasilonema sennae CENA114 TaxID=415709 RepID=A0A856MH06_9CYAN|nr:CHASE2 domain-containing protein [Brasilonema sennae]QDL09978.1 protein kinase [Brasilonema sennae CENA114]QDL16330.1 protein kinase [Brasilonema octagenarum UFV-E1]
MAPEPTTLTKKNVSAANRSSKISTKAPLTVLARRSKRLARLGHLLAGVSAVGAALLAASSLNLAKFMENQAQTTFYLLRVPETPPKEIVILAIDEQSISLGEQYYKADPQKYSFFEPLQAFPFKRAAYAQVIEKLIKAGARSVAVDVVFSTPSSYGVEDDQKLRESVQRYGSKVTLAALYEESQTHQGQVMQLTQPRQMFRTGSVAIGTVNFPLEVDGKIHKLANEYSKVIDKEDALTVKMLSFDEATLRAAQVDYPPPKGDRIHFHGPEGTFNQIPFWYVLDPENWNTYLQQGKFFKDKIVLIGSTAKSDKGDDYHSVPAMGNWLYPERMSGVEVHANAIATLMQDKAITEAIKNPFIRGLFVLCLVSGCGVIIAFRKRGITRFVVSIALAISWGGISYLIFVHNLLILPTAVPVVAIAMIGLAYLGTEVSREIIRKIQLVNIMNQFPSDRVVQEIISQQDDLKDLLQKREMAVSGKILDGRYKIVKVLGAGGFSETYIAEDIKLPNNPLCVVKQLKPANSKPEQLEIARRLFSSEAQALQKQGSYKQIPQLLAYFEEDEEFYLVQEYIIGHALSQEMLPGQRLLETRVIEILQDLLETLVFVHNNNVIHRDIKPSNIIRRDSDGKLVLIDFGAVKEVTTQILDHSEQTAFTIGIGTRGYAPSEQCYGRPQYSSDIYAVGMIGIKALTGMAPHEIERDANSELKWVDKAYVSQSLSDILTKMVREDFRQRYQSASQALEALARLSSQHSERSLLQHKVGNISLEEIDTPTTPWTGISEDSSQSAVSTSLLPSRYENSIEDCQDLPTDTRP